jgi:hypothetical protein
MVEDLHVISLRVFNLQMNLPGREVLSKTKKKSLECFPYPGMGSACPFMDIMQLAWIIPQHMISMLTFELLIDISILSNG